ncbi:hypothetical protein SSX86_008965 [Deinandra increscens subsp. villosa]|uniref:RING-type E3 ubiquitin transferase n=1 Tax=Deinandra increscens subsp. villosa TaxID=3103831 RepID=A0AAP0DDN5_9ASTR
MEEEGSQSTGFWCYECSRAVETITEVETVKCSLCHGGFVEELDISRSTDNRNHNHNHNHHHQIGDSESDRTLSLWAPILLGMMSNPRRLRRFRQIESDNENDDSNGSEVNRGLQSVVRRRRRSSATILQLLQGARGGMITESSDDHRERDRERERVIVINPFNQRIVFQGAGARPFGSGGSPQNHQTFGSFGDYFVGPDMDLLLQHLAENSPARYGSPPAQKKAVETMPTVRIDRDLNNLILCSVCLDDFEIGNEAKEMPCKHRFHGECILTWLELHSTCPVCRFQLPSDESKVKRERESESSRGIAVNRLIGPGNENSESGQDGDLVGRNTRRFSVTLPWPFNSLFTPTSGSQLTNPHSIISPSASPGSGSGTGQEGGGGGEEDDH